MPTAHEQFSEQFRKWELRGRGWQVFDQPVHPEPPFVPFDFHRLQEPPAIDNGLRPTFLSSLYRKLTAPPPEPPPDVPEPEDEPEPHPLVREKIVEFQASLPDKLDISKEAFEQFLLNLSLCREPIAFELLGVHKRVTAQFAAAAADASLLRRQLQAYFPEAVFQLQENILKQIWNTCSGKDEWVIEFGLAHEFMLPLANGKLDPFIGILGALAELQPGELGLFQVLFQPAHEPWPESIMRSVTHADGKPFFVNSPELAGAAEHKISKPLYAAVVRIVVKTGAKERTLQIARDVAGSLRVFAHPTGNELIPLKNDGYPFAEHIEDLLQRQSRRSGMILNSDELTGFVHLPSSAVRSPVLQRQTTKTKAAPTIARHGNALLGNNDHAGQTVEVRLSPEQRTRHCHIIGASGTGKSTLLFNLIKNDIEKGEGIAVLDPHGDLIDRILGIIPESRINDVVLVDPSDEQFSVGFNILSAHSDLEKNLLASDLVSVFQRLSTSWGDQMNSVLKNAILAFLESDRRGTLADLQQFLIETPFRNEFLKSVKDTYVVNYWQKSFPLLSGTKSIGSILTRLDTFLAQKPIRYMVSQPENRLDFAHIMDSGKIFLAKLPEGLLGRENSHLLGTLLVSKFQQTAMSRQAQQITERRDFWLYIDEFANFITPSMAEILSGARKYRIGLTLAHHELHQLQRNPEVASAVMSHPYTRIVFRVGDDDAKKLGEGFAFFEANDLRNLETGQAIGRVERSDYDFNLSVPLPAEPDKNTAATRRQEVITASRKKYGTARADVEAKLAKSRDAGVPVPAMKTEPSAKPVDEPPKVAEVPKAAAQESEDEEGQHNAIKERIRIQAETLDYSVTFEELVAGSQGRADVVLRRGTHSIACEITVTTPVEYEVANLTKCLKGNFQHIAAISRNRKKLERIRQLLSETATPEQIARVGFYLPEEFMSKIYDWAMQDPAGAAVERGKPNKRKIDFNFTQLTEGERRQREADMLKSLIEIMRQK
jgi:type IV secretion system coupling TraD/TrwB family protein